MQISFPAHRDDHLWLSVILSVENSIYRNRNTSNEKCKWSNLKCQEVSICGKLPPASWDYQCITACLTFGEKRCCEMRKERIFHVKLLSSWPLVLFVCCLTVALSSLSAVLLEANKQHAVVGVLLSHITYCCPLKPLVFAGRKPGVNIMCSSHQWTTRAMAVSSYASPLFIEVILACQLPLDSCPVCSELSEFTKHSLTVI